MPEGVIKQIDLGMKSGSLASADGEDFYNFRSINVSGGFDNFKVLRPGQKVSFDLLINPLHQKEVNNIKLIGAENQANHTNNALSEMPYGFKMINIDQAVTESPVWHDGSSGGDLLSGEILCTLKALTPLLPGNARYKVDEADQTELRQWGFGDLDKEKQISEPLLLEDGRVVIAGSAFKGMLRHSLGALLSAPMERVEEHHYTYRPNLGHAHSAIRECRPAVVDRRGNDEWIVKVLPQARDAVFRIYEKPSDAIAFTYAGGIDGMGILAATGLHKTKVYRQAFVSKRKLDDAISLTISKSVYDAYKKTQKVLVSDHISKAHPNDFDQIAVAKAINDATPLQENQLIYVEIEKNTANPPEYKIVSFGHHFQYRWAYTSSIRKQDGKLRACLTPKNSEKNIPEEKQNEKDVKPEYLTGARLLFGYVHNDEDTPIGKGIFKRLAGRIAPNHAISEAEPSFLGNKKTGFCVPLKVLGSPKSSSWECYLQQSADVTASPQTYGDLPGDKGGELAGRKYYRHQPAVQDVKDIAETDPELVASKLSTLARYICKPGTTFKFTLRFARLREWELGALLAVLQPDQLAENSKPVKYAHKLGLGRPLGMGSVCIITDQIRLRQEKDTRFMENNDVEKHKTQALVALKDKLATNKIATQDWLTMHAYTDHGRLDYSRSETKVDGQTVMAIYAWHTKIRRDYSKLRRERNPDWQPLKKMMKALQKEK